MPPPVVELSRILVHPPPDSNKLRIEKCTIDGKDTTCLWSYALEIEWENNAFNMFYDFNSHVSYKCDNELKECEQIQLHDTELLQPISNKSGTVSKIEKINIDDLKANLGQNKRYYIHTDINDSKCSGGIKICLTQTQPSNVDNDKLPLILEVKGNIIKNTCNDWIWRR